MLIKAQTQSRLNTKFGATVFCDLSIHGYLRLTGDFSIYFFSLEINSYTGNWRSHTAHKNGRKANGVKVVLNSVLNSKVKNQYKIKIQYGMTAVFLAISREIPKVKLSTVHKHDYIPFLPVPRLYSACCGQYFTHVANADLLFSLICKHCRVMTTFTELYLI